MILTAAQKRNWRIVLKVLLYPVRDGEHAAELWETVEEVIVVFVTNEYALQREHAADVALDRVATVAPL